MNKYPIYIPSKGRSETRLTINALNKMGADYKVIVEEQEFEAYNKYIPKEKLLILPMEFKEKYEYCDKFGLEKSSGSGPARNFAWEHSKSLGHKRHWIMDDNIRDFYVYNQNKKIRINNTIFFGKMEEFCDQYLNVAMAGPHYFFFAVAKQKYPPFLLNRRIFSCNLILNSVNYRWRGRFNEDAILSLDLLKAGYCTVLFYSFLQGKMKTQSLKGGNTESLYKKYGTLEKSQMLVNVHPDLVRLAFRYGRWHHHISYGKYEKNFLIKDPNAKELKKINFSFKNKGE